MRRSAARESGASFQAESVTAIAWQESAHTQQLSLRFPEAVSELRRFWQRRYYDFNVYSRKKLWEKLHYMHANPVEERLVKHPRDWPWSSWSYYARGRGLLKIDAV